MKPRLFFYVLLIGMVVLIAHLATTTADADPDGCTWGASSVVWENGHVVAGPTTTGCVP